MKEIYILGAGGFAKEVYGLILDIGNFSIEGFISKEEASNIQMGDSEIPVLSEEQFFKKKLSSETSLALGIGDPKLTELLSIRFAEYNFPNLIHPKATLNVNLVSLNKGNIITSGVILTSHISIGSFNIFNLNTTIGHDVEIGDFNIFNPSVNISGGVIIKNNNLFGVSSVVLQNIQIGNSNTIGACTLIHRNRELNHATVVGVPGKIIK
mgnify:CR=1 FL=1|jgi:sugar O-acyltransferase (sialic acid O-acetyltransferase NeuD family)